MKNVNRAIYVAALLCGTTYAAPALAQGAEESGNSNEIIVTAQRRSEKLEEVPMAVTVVTSETLANAGVTSLRDLANVTSGYQLGGGGAFPQPAVRGVTTVINGSFENNVAVYVDGVYQPVAQAINIDLPNVDNIQVLKGPQGTLYGRNATGGAILLSTITPGDTWKGKAEFTYARFNDIRGSAYVAGPISEKVGLSLAGYVRRSDGYMRLASRTTPGVTTCCAIPLDQDAIRAKLKFQLTESFKATLAYNYVRISDSRTNAYSPFENVNPGGTTVYSRPGGATLPKGLGVQAYDIGAIMDSRQHEGSLTLELDTGSGTLKSITAYAQVKTHNDFDFDGSYIPASYSRNRIRERTFQQTLDFTTSAIDKIDLTVGATYFHDKLLFSPTENWGGNNPLVSGATPSTIADYTLLSTGVFDQKKNAWAIYGDLTFHATDKLSINVGGRYSEEKQDMDVRIEGNPALLTPACQLFACNALVAPNLTVGAATYGALNRARTFAHATFKKFTPRASIRYEIAPRTNVYFTYSQGFRSGAFNVNPPACVNAVPVAADCYLPAKQETIDSYELGFKIAGSNFRFEMAGFYYDYKNLQVSATRASAAGTPIVDITNSPKAKIYGIDANFEYKPTDRFTVRGSATWLHARYGEGFLFGGTGVTNRSGVGISPNADPLKNYLNVSQTQDLSNLQMSRAPNFSANLGVDYDIPNGDGGLRFSVNVKYTDSYVVTNPSVWGTVLTAEQMAAVKVAQNNTDGVPADRLGVQRFREGAYALLNASVTWTHPSGHYYVRVWGTNLTDHKYRLHYSGTASGTYAPQAEPLVVGGTIGYKF